jgi:hypothetical protein
LPGLASGTQDEGSFGGGHDGTFVVAAAAAGAQQMPIHRAALVRQAHRPS